MKRLTLEHFLKKELLIEQGEGGVEFTGGSWGDLNKTNNTNKVPEKTTKTKSKKTPPKTPPKTTPKDKTPTTGKFKFAVSQNFYNVVKNLKSSEYSLTIEPAYTNDKFTTVGDEVHFKFINTNDSSWDNIDVTVRWFVNSTEYEKSADKFNMTTGFTYFAKKDGKEYDLDYLRYKSAVKKQLKYNTFTKDADLWSLKDQSRWYSISAMINNPVEALGIFDWSDKKYIFKNQFLPVYESVLNSLDGFIGTSSNFKAYHGSNRDWYYFGDDDEYGAYHDKVKPWLKNQAQNLLKKLDVYLEECGYGDAVKKSMTSEKWSSDGTVTYMQPSHYLRKNDYWGDKMLENYIMLKIQFNPTYYKRGQSPDKYYWDYVSKSKEYTLSYCFIWNWDFDFNYWGSDGAKAEKEIDPDF